MKLTGTPRRLVFMPGRPAPEQEGQWLGLDANGGLYVLRWEQRESCWIALGFETVPNRREKNWPHIVLLKGKSAQHIVSHAAGPVITGAPFHG